MRLIDADELTLYYGGLIHISPYDFEGTAKYFAQQVKAARPVEAIPCEFIQDKIQQASGPERTYLVKLIEEWRKDGGMEALDGCHFQADRVPPNA